MPQDDLMVKMILSAWNIQVSRADKLLEALSDEQLLQEIAPGRNRGYYILGHLTGIHDMMVELLDLGQRKYPLLENQFVSNPDKADIPRPPMDELRNCWKEVSERIDRLFGRVKAEQWFQKHRSISEADFEKEPHRNKLSVVITRTNHLAYHLGQLVLLKS
jgi:hypothetical protein